MGIPYLILVVLLGIANIQLFINNKKTKHMSQALDNLTQRVTEITNVSESIIALLGNVKTKLDEALANNDTAALEALSATLGTETQHLADAITANTPASPTA